MHNQQLIQQANNNVLFCGIHSSYFFTGLKNQLEKEIEEYTQEYILNVDFNELIPCLFEKYQITPLQCLIEEKNLDTVEMDLSGALFPKDVTPAIRPTSFYKRDLYKIYVPFTGDVRLLKVSPIPRSPIAIIRRDGLPDNTWKTHKENEVIFSIIDFHNDIKRVQAEISHALSCLEQNSTMINDEAHKYNNSLKELTHTLLKKRKEIILKKISDIKLLNIPLRKSRHIPETFAISPTKKVKLLLPEIKAAKQEVNLTPTLLEASYKSIIDDIFIIGRQIEKTPSIYKDKSEENLRDLFWLLLEFNYTFDLKFSTTGETFNKVGKTDLLIKYNGENIFVAEMKFWRGKSTLHPTIDQILKYLTWRDSKSSIIFFVDNKEVGAAWQDIISHVKDHQQFISCNETNFNSDKLTCKLKIPNTDAETTLTILLFHFPK